MTDISTKLDYILEKLIFLEKDIQYLKSEIEYIKKGNDTMIDHISFVEKVYDTIKNPFYFILNKIKPIYKIPEKIKNE
jgi:glycerol-3-phosphate responsive antiterminator